MAKKDDPQGKLPAPPSVEPDGNEPPGLVMFLTLMLRDLAPAAEVERLVVQAEQDRSDGRGTEGAGPLVDLASTYARRIIGPDDGS